MLSVLQCRGPKNLTPRSVQDGGMGLPAQDHRSTGSFSFSGSVLCCAALCPGDRHLLRLLSQSNSASSKQPLAKWLDVKSSGEGEGGEGEGRDREPGPS